MTVVIICQTCGNKNEADADFCWFDGEPLEWVGKRVDEDTGQPVDEAGGPDDSVYDLGPLYQEPVQPEPARGRARRPRPLRAGAAPRRGRAARPRARAGPGCGCRARAAGPRAGRARGARARGCADPAPAVQEEEHDNAAEQLLKKLPGRRRKETAQPAAAAAPPAAPAPPAPAGSGAAPPPPPSAPSHRTALADRPPAAHACRASGRSGRCERRHVGGPARAAGPGRRRRRPRPRPSSSRGPRRRRHGRRPRTRRPRASPPRRRRSARRPPSGSTSRSRPSPSPSWPRPRRRPSVVEEPVKLTWWQRFVAWVKRLFGRESEAGRAGRNRHARPGRFRRSGGGRRASGRRARRSPGRCRRCCGSGDAVDCDARGTYREAAGSRGPDRTAAREGKQTGPKVPSALKPTKEYERKARTEKKVEEAPQYDPGDLICTQCGTGNKPTSKFCKRCGTSLAEAPAAVQPSWFKRMLTKLHLRRGKRFEAGYRKRQKDAGKQSIFWRLQNLGFRTFGLVFLAIGGDRRSTRPGGPPSGRASIRSTTRFTTGSCRASRSSTRSPPRRARISRATSRRRSSTSRSTPPGSRSRRARTGHFRR